jgi:hypothetical protein
LPIRRKEKRESEGRVAVEYERTDGHIGKGSTMEPFLCKQEKERMSCPLLGGALILKGVYIFTKVLSGIYPYGDFRIATFLKPTGLISI